METGLPDVPGPGGFDGGPCPVLSGVDFGDPSCDSCATASCCSVGAGCYTPADSGGFGSCAILATCEADCEDVDAGVPDGGLGLDASPDAMAAATAAAIKACQAECVSMYKSAVKPYEALQACVVGKCQNEAGTGPCN